MIEIVFILAAFALLTAYGYYTWPRVTPPARRTEPTPTEVASELDSVEDEEDT